jgi:hypothetical protein
MQKSCAVCRKPFEAKRPAAKYCGQTCRQRAHRRPDAAAESKVLELPAEPTSELAPAVGGSVTAATVAELEAAGRLETALGQAAVALARRIDAGASEPGSSFASLVRQHGATLTEAVKDAKTAVNPLDELKSRRERKLAGG